MARKTFASFEILWYRHEKLYTEIFENALVELSKKDCIIGNEDDISEMLCPILSQICFDLNEKQNIEVRYPCWEKPIQPVTEADITGGRNKKRPDFTCNCYDSNAESLDQYVIPLHIECKLIGEQTSPSWILNKNYVKNGISRFDSITHEYGKGAPSGLLIGYMISMSPFNIETEINKYQANIIPEYPLLKFNFNELKNHTNSNQDLRRKNVKPIEFKLIHIWVDIRHNHKREVTTQV